LFDARPHDQITVDYNHQVISAGLANLVDAKSSLTSIFARHATNTIPSPIRPWSVPGVFATLGVSYTDNPAVTYMPKEVGHTLTFEAATFLVF
jgi:porin